MTGSHNTLESSWAWSIQRHQWFNTKSRANQPLFDIRGFYQTQSGSVNHLICANTEGKKILDFLLFFNREELKCLFTRRFIWPTPAFIPGLLLRGIILLVLTISAYIAVISWGDWKDFCINFQLEEFERVSLALLSCIIVACAQCVWVSIEKKDSSRKQSKLSILEGVGLWKWSYKVKLSIKKFPLKDKVCFN